MARNMLKWLYPGIRVKRWLLLIGLGIAVLTLGASHLVQLSYATGFRFPDWVGVLALHWLHPLARAAIFGALGLALIGIGFMEISRTLLRPFVTPGENIADVIYREAQMKQGPHVVAIGGGHGLPNLLRGVKEYTGNVTAIVTVADDGGSSGVLRRELGIMPPGDIRNCIVALADVEPTMADLFQYRFTEGSGLEGHSFGNLFIAAMTAVTGNIERAIEESCRVLAVRGRILPSTLENVTMCAELSGERIVEGESKIGTVGERIRRVFLNPNPSANPAAVEAILNADLIILGPGSLYTSVLPNLLVEGISNAIIASPAVKVYVCNVATQPGETDKFHVSDHIEAIFQHTGSGLFNYVVANDNLRYHIPEDKKAAQVELNGARRYHGQQGLYLVRADVVDEANPVRHDPRKLARAVMQLYWDKSADRRSFKARPDVNGAGTTDITSLEHMDMPSSVPPIAQSHS